MRLWGGCADEGQQEGSLGWGCWVLDRGGRAARPHPSRVGRAGRLPRRTLAHGRSSTGPLRGLEPHGRGLGSDPGKGRVAWSSSAASRHVSQPPQARILPRGSAPGGVLGSWGSQGKALRLWRVAQRVSSQVSGRGTSCGVAPLPPTRHPWPCTAWFPPSQLSAPGSGEGGGQAANGRCLTHREPAGLLSSRAVRLAGLVGAAACRGGCPHSVGPVCPRACVCGVACVAASC